ncbi:MAG: hypothetical protein JWO02_616, partial [Solirubrobacterales bacterium]|nr:hypothetical protein [Solirubrobacterales bacterium]
MPRTIIGCPARMPGTLIRYPLQWFGLTDE